MSWLLLPLSSLDGGMLLLLLLLLLWLQLWLLLWLLLFMVAER